MSESKTPEEAAATASAASPASESKQAPAPGAGPATDTPPREGQDKEKAKAKAKEGATENGEAAPARANGATASERLGKNATEGTAKAGSAGEAEGAAKAGSAAEPEGAAKAGSAGEPEGAPKAVAEAEADAKTRTDGAATTKTAAGADLLPKGNPLRRVRGGVTAGIGIFLTYLIMAHNGQLRMGVPLGIVLVAVATFGVMDLLGTFDDAEEHVVSKTTLAALTQPLLRVGGGLLIYALSVAGAASGLFSAWVWAFVVPAAFLALVAAVFDLGVKLGPWRVDELGLARPLWQREGFWVVAAGAVLLLPALGSYALWDPWETHYGEVAREILARDDWISLWWAQDGWFWSKPILNFWLQAIFMATLGVHYKPDEMLMGIGGATARPEWVVRTPVFLLTVLAMYLIYKGVAKAFGRRAGLIGALVLATMPDWYFISHQTMADMPCIAPMTAAMGLLMCGLMTDPEKRVKAYEVKAGGLTLRLTAWHMVFGAIVLISLPQIIYLFSRNLELVVHGDGPYGFRAHWDEFRSGSGGGNCGLPGNEACASTPSASIPPSLHNGVDGFFPMIWRFVGAFEPALQAIVWAAVLGTVLYLNWGERRGRRLFYLAAWFFAAIGTMGKGPEGFALPMLCTFVYLCVTRRLGELLRLEIISGLLIILCVGLPWYVASYVRHGPPFTDRLIFHDMFNRAFHHVHDTNEGDDTSFRFYIWQLGYALFPWTGLAALGLTYWIRKPDATGERRNDVPILLAMWFLFGFALFTFMGTKFHHYIFPCVPPIAMLLGIVLNDLIGPGPLLSRGLSAGELPSGSRANDGLLLHVVGALSGVALTVAGIARFLPGSFLGTKNGSDLAPPSYVLGTVLTAAGVAVLYFALKGFRAGPPAPEAAPPVTAESKSEADTGAPYRDDAVAFRAPSDPESQDRAARHERLMIGGAVASAAFILAIIARDLILKPDNADQPGAIRLLQLFTYNYRRSWPDSLDFSAALAAFSVVAVVMGLLLAVRSLRRPVTVGLLALSFVWAAWGLDVYMVKTAPHWGQHEVIQAYYDNRKGPEEPLVAYQMNWKGENFYTGNKIPAFVSSGATFTNWLKQEREKGVKVMYFVTEHGRVGGLKNEVGGKNYRELTDKVLCNKFVMVRAEL